MEPGRVRHALLLLLLLLGSSPLGPQDVAAATSAAPKSARRQRAEVELRQAFLDLQVPVQGAPPPKLSHASQASPWGSPSTSSTNHTPPVGLAVKLEDWGLFATLSSLATAILHAVGSERTLCLKSARPGKRVMNSWPYYPSAEFETKHGCTSYRCYLALASKVDLFPRGCGAVWRKARRKTATKAINVVNNEFECATHFPALERFGVPVSELREIVVMWLFEPTAPVKAYVDRRRQQTAWPWPWPWPRSGSDEVALPGHASPHGVSLGIITIHLPTAASPPHNPTTITHNSPPSRLKYAAVHVRWGDKLNTETVGRALTAEHYVNAARGVMRATKTATLFLATTSPRAVVEIRRGLNPPNESLVVPTISTRLDDSKAKEARCVPMLVPTWVLLHLVFCSLPLLLYP
jgi:hypothetical protein